MNQQAKTYAMAASASAQQAQSQSMDPAVKKLAEAIGYLGLAIASSDK